MNLIEIFGGIDIYLFDQLQKGRFVPGSRILDAGCGGGRNLMYFAQHGFDVAGVDISPESVQHTRELVSGLASDQSTAMIRTSPIESLPFDDATFDAVICSAVLHFAKDEDHFHAMIDEMWRVLKPGGLFFARLATTIGVENLVEQVDGRWYNLPDGSSRFLCDEEMLLGLTQRLNGRLADPIKTTIVQNMRSMTTWVLWKEKG